MSGEDEGTTIDPLGRLGLPGLIDCHVHFLPPPIEAAVWKQFDTAGPKIGREWPILYRQSAAERVELLRGFGVKRFSTLPYAHKPGVAGYLNDWSAEFAAEVPEVIRSATFYPEEGVAEYVADQIGGPKGGVELFKLHTQVGEFHLDDPLLKDAWGHVEDAGTPVMVHAGSGPVANDFTGAASMGRLLADFPRLRLICAHFGMPEHDDFMGLAERYENVLLDTSMAFTSFFADKQRDFSGLVPRMVDLQPKILFGSDFPTLPFPYMQQLDELVAFTADAGDDFLRDVLWNNGAALFGVREDG